MRVLVATTRTNGRLDGDCYACVEGELVLVGEPCFGHGDADADADTGADTGAGCACARAFTGLGPRGATTTALVVVSELSEADVREAVRGGLEDRGVIDPDRTTRAAAEGLVDEALARVLAVAGHFPPGTVVGRRGERVFPRVGG